MSNDYEDNPRNEEDMHSLFSSLKDRPPLEQAEMLYNLGRGGEHVSGLAKHFKHAYASRIHDAMPATLYKNVFHVLQQPDAPQRYDSFNAVTDHAAHRTVNWVMDTLNRFDYFLEHNNDNEGFTRHVQDTDAVYQHVMQDVVHRLHRVDAFLAEKPVEPGDVFDPFTLPQERYDAVHAVLDAAVCKNVLNQLADHPVDGYDMFFDVVATGVETLPSYLSTRYNVDMDDAANRVELVPVFENSSITFKAADTVVGDGGVTW